MLVRGLRLVACFLIAMSFVVEILPSHHHVFDEGLVASSDCSGARQTHVHGADLQLRYPCALASNLGGTPLPTTPVGHAIEAANRLEGLESVLLPQPVEIAAGPPRAPPA